MKLFKKGMAIFETDHFSTYILTESGVTNPNTGDNILTNMLLGGISFWHWFIY